MSTDSEASEGSWTLCPPTELDVTSQYVYYLSRYGPTQLIQFGLKDPVTDISAKPFDNVKQVIFFIPGELRTFFLITSVNDTVSIGNPGPISMYR